MVSLYRLTDRPELRVTAKVVGILKPSWRRTAVVGVVKEEPGGAGALFLCPCDPRLPRCLIRSSQLLPNLKSTLKVTPDFVCCRPVCLNGCNEDGLPLLEKAVFQVFEEGSAHMS